MLVINGYTAPSPQHNGFKVSRNKVWSSNTGRAADGGTVGDLVGIKYKLEIQWPYLTQSQINEIDKAVSAPFFPVTFANPVTGGTSTITCYAGDATYPVYSWAGGKLVCTGVGVNLIER